MFSMMMIAVASDWTNTTTTGVQDFAGNPILKPAGSTGIGEWVLGDPTVVLINSTIHMWANEEIHGVLHYTADAADPTKFSLLGETVAKPGANRPYAYYDQEKNSVVLFYEQYTASALFKASKLVWIESISGPQGGSWKWTSPKVALEPTLPWEKIGTQRVGNPFVFFHTSTSKWRLHYSASSIHLNDSNVDEPLHLGLAESDELRGNWTRVTTTPVTIEGGTIPNETFVGVGSFKMVKGGATAPVIQALMNRITLKDGTDITGSTMCTVEQADDTGTKWKVVTASFIAPTPSANPPTWKQSYVYGFDTIADPTDPSRTLVYYNARNGWKGAHEAVGVSRVDSTFA
jgi:hypothetical protein